MGTVFGRVRFHLALWLAPQRVAVQPMEEKQGHALEMQPLHPCRFADSSLMLPQPKCLLSAMKSESTCYWSQAGRRVLPLHTITFILYYMYLYRPPALATLVEFWSKKCTSTWSHLSSLQKTWRVVHLSSPCPLLVAWTLSFLVSWWSRWGEVGTRPCHEYQSLRLCASCRSFDGVLGICVIDYGVLPVCKSIKFLKEVSSKWNPLMTVRTR